MTTNTEISHKLDPILLPSVMLLLHDKFKTKPTSENINMYTEPDVSEARNILPVLDALESRLEELLEQWPQNLTLEQVY